MKKTAARDAWKEIEPSVARIVATATYINQPTGRFDHAASVYFASVPLPAGKSVAAVALPTTGTSPNPGLHVFAMAVS